MKFPDLIILDEIPNEKKIGDYKTLLVCKLDWNQLDNYRIKKSKEWFLKFLLEERTKDEERVFKLILDEYDWESELYPNKFKKDISILDSFNMPKTYYDEIKHFENLALGEWNRKRIFDTIVREACLSPAIESVYLYFYLIKDAIHLWNRNPVDEYHHELIDIVVSVSLFRFWKGQTGVDLVKSRALGGVNKESKLYRRLYDAYDECIDLSIVPSRDEKELHNLVKSRMRDEKINGILK